MERMYTIPEVAEATGLAKSTIYEAVKKGDLKSIRLGQVDGKGIRVRASAVDEWIDSKTVVVEQEGTHRGS